MQQSLGMRQQYLVTVEVVYKREALRSFNDHLFFVKENKLKYV